MNSSNRTNASQPTPDYVYEALNIASIVFVIVDLILHTFYCLMIVAFKESRKRTFFYTIHTNLMCAFFGTLSIGYAYDKYPNTPYPSLNQFLCMASEILWIGTKYLMMYSILLMAIYRYVAVFSPHKFKKLNDSLFLLLTPVVGIWLISIGFPVVSKYIFRTTVSSSMCLDGFSTSLDDTIGYFVFNYTMLFLIPCVLTVGIYVKITLRLRELGRNLVKSPPRTLQTVTNGTQKTINKEESASVNGASQPMFNETKRKSERRFANQFIIMCSLMFFSVVILSIFQLRSFIPGFFTVWMRTRTGLRILLSALLAGIPLTSLYYHPYTSKVVAKIAPIA